MITSAHSQFTTGRIIPTRTTEDLLLGSWELIRQTGRVSRRLIWDNETGIGRRGRLARRGGHVHRDVGHHDRAAASPRPRVRGDRGTEQRLLRDLVHARPRAARRPTSTCSSQSGWTRRTARWCAPCGPARLIWSTRTGPRCSSVNVPPLRGGRPQVAGALYRPRRSAGPTETATSALETCQDLPPGHGAATQQTSRNP